MWYLDALQGVKGHFEEYLWHDAHIIVRTCEMYIVVFVAGVKANQRSNIRDGNASFAEFM